MLHIFNAVERELDRARFKSCLVGFRLNQNGKFRTLGVLFRCKCSITPTRLQKGLNQSDAISLWTIVRLLRKKLHNETNIYVLGIRAGPQTMKLRIK